MMRNKKAIEPVIGTVLLIAVTIVVVALVVAFVVPFVQKGTTEADACLDARLIIDDTTCYNSSANSGTLKLYVSRPAVDFNMNSYIISIVSATGTKTDTGNKINAPLGQDVKTITNVGAGELTSVTVAPVVNVAGGGTKNCDVTTTYSPVPACV